MFSHSPCYIKSRCDAPFLAHNQKLNPSHSNKRHTGFHLGSGGRRRIGGMFAATTTASLLHLFLAKVCFVLFLRIGNYFVPTIQQPFPVFFLKDAAFKRRMTMQDPNKRRTGCHFATEWHAGNAMPGVIPARGTLRRLCCDIHSIASSQFPLWTIWGSVTLLYVLIKRYFFLVSQRYNAQDIHDHGRSEWAAACHFGSEWNAGDPILEVIAACGTGVAFAATTTTASLSPGKLALNWRSLAQYGQVLYGQIFLIVVLRKGVYKFWKQHASCWLLGSDFPVG